jgi:hypothetical protein
LRNIGRRNFIPSPLFFILQNKKDYWRERSKIKMSNLNKTIKVDLQFGADTS